MVLDLPRVLLFTCTLLLTAQGLKRFEAFAHPCHWEARSPMTRKSEELCEENYL